MYVYVAPPRKEDPKESRPRKKVGVKERCRWYRGSVCIGLNGDQGIRKASVTGSSQKGTANVGGKVPLINGVFHLFYFS